MLKIVIYAQKKDDFEYLKDFIDLKSIIVSEVLWCHSNTKSRSDVINENLNCWLLFLDHDCRPNNETFNILSSLPVLKNDKNYNQVITGLYDNPGNVNYLQKAHNFIANCWLEQSYEINSKSKLLLGGIFLIYSNKPIIISDHEIFWGGEDKLLAYTLQDNGFIFEKNNSIKVFHQTSSKFVHFVRRAYLHGVNEIKYIKINRNKINYFFWIRKIGFANISLLPIILLHFCIQKVGQLIQIIPLKNRQ